MRWVFGSVYEHLDNSYSFVPSWGALTACGVDVQLLPLNSPVGTRATWYEPMVDLKLADQSAYDAIMCSLTGYS